MRFEHFGRGGGFLFCGTKNKNFLKFLKFDFEDLHPRLLRDPLMRPNKVKTVAVKRLSIYIYIYMYTENEVLTFDKNHTLKYEIVLAYSPRLQ